MLLSDDVMNSTNNLFKRKIESSAKALKNEGEENRLVDFVYNENSDNLNL